MLDMALRFSDLQSKVLGSNSLQSSDQPAKKIPTAQRSEEPMEEEYSADDSEEEGPKVDWSRQIIDTSSNEP